MADSKSNLPDRLRCHHCAGPLSKEMETSDWTVPPLIRDSFSMIGSAVGGTTSAFYGFNHVMPIVRKWIKGPMWLHFLIGSFSTKVLCACAGTTCNSILFSLCWFSRLNHPCGVFYLYYRKIPPTQPQERKKPLFLIILCYIKKKKKNFAYFSYILMK
ncbi:uncharacterized protein LOC110620774 isoform X2 [Manihot esculenta]|uniref:uncharacterized protein LOC110620774 isoform X2 n=1 Tax=Manihot esculenta TaxID=3983 RepID=UPI000B5D1BD1|nr:uncharacterized protein LOC110620774 isoform X2 [Manihot esculenta]